MDKPSKFTLEIHGMKFTAECPSSDITIDEYLDWCRGFAYLAGFRGLDEYFVENNN